MVVRELRGGQLRFLKKKQIRKIYSGSLEILGSIGMKSASDEILNVFANAGADVDIKTKIVKIPEHLVEDALRKAPSKVIIHGRHSERAIVLEDQRVYFGFGGTPTPYILDVETGKWRKPGKKDVADATRLGDAIPNMDFIMSIAGAYDVPYEVEYLHGWDAILNNTVKPIVFAAPGAFNMRQVLEMGAAISGGEAELRKKPPFGVYTEMPSPLMFDISSENILEAAPTGVPIIMGQMPMLGATAPVTIAGAAVLSNAENLAALTLAQLANPGSPFVLCAYVTLMDPRTGRCAYGSPEFALGNIVNAELACYYDLPSFGWGGCSDSKIPDAQAGAEVMMNALTAALSGTNLIHDCGYLAGGSIGSMEMAIICEEVVGMVKRIVRGFEVNDETLAIDVIKSVGPGKHFLTNLHTLKHLEKEVYITKLFDRSSEVRWIKTGRKKVRTVAKERVKRILAEHEAKSLPPEVQEKIRGIIRDAEEQLLQRS
jgi:trimethylamine--corrinoid protein Co-methyltransferase